MKITGKPPGAAAAHANALKEVRVNPIEETQPLEAIDPRKEHEKEKTLIFPDIDPNVSNIPALKDILTPK